MNKIKLGIIKEGKVPPDKRVPLTPSQCVQVQAKFSNVEVVVQSSNIRCFSDESYSELGIKVVNDVADCDILMGVKEVPIDQLIPNKKYLFFSHTIKKQVYNQKLLRAILDKQIQLIDYETIKNKLGKRIIGFGRYAGIVGAYNGVLAYGKRKELFDILPANKCFDRSELNKELAKVKFPSSTKIVLTGFGRVGNGAREIMDLLPIIEVTPEEFLTQQFDEAVFTHLEVEDYFKRLDGSAFVKSEFYSNPEKFTSNFEAYAFTADMYIACHYWSSKSPLILTQESLASDKNKLIVIADVSCDIALPIASTLRPSKINDPVYGYDPILHQEVSWNNPGAITVMAVDNLPCEMPKDASEDFGNELIRHVFPHLFGKDEDKIIENASETDLNGNLTPNFAYLQDFANEKI